MKSAWAALALVLVATTVLMAYTVRTRNSPVPSPPAVRRAVLNMLPQRIDGVIYELGAGWGGLSLALARRCPDNRVVAYELSPLPWAVARMRAALSGAGNLEIRRRDFMAEGLSDAGALTAYLSPGSMARLRPKLNDELPDGSVLVSSAFPVQGWQPAKVVEASDEHATYVYRYVMPPEAGEAPTKPYLGFP